MSVAGAEPGSLAAVLALVVVVVVGAGSGCGDDVGQVPLGAVPMDGGAMADPLAVPPDVVPDGSFDAIATQIFAPRCAGVPGLCHSGQFEPNLATPAVAWASLVRRPARENPSALRVDPGSPETSFLVAKLRGTAGSSQMPLGAAPLSEESLALIEEWIRDGAPRTPGGDPAPALNEPPRPPEVGVFDADTGERLDDPGALLGRVPLAVGDRVVLRMSVDDVETADEDVPFAVFSLRVGNAAFLLHPERETDAELGFAVYDDGDDVPLGAGGDALSFAYELSVPAAGELLGPTGRTPLTVAGTTFDVIAAYLDDLPERGGLAAFTARPQLLEVAE